MRIVLRKRIKYMRSEKKIFIFLFFSTMNIMQDMKKTMLILFFTIFNSRVTRAEERQSKKHE